MTPQPQLRFECIQHPTKQELTMAACIMFAFMEKEIEGPYAFIGGAAIALLDQPPRKTERLEILVDYDLNAIENSISSSLYSEYLAKVPVEQSPIVLIYKQETENHHRGVALRFVRAGCHDYPNHLIGPEIEHGQNGFTSLEHTFCRIRVLDSNNDARDLPVLRGRMLLAQKILSFSNLDAAEMMDNVWEIKQLLVVAANFREGSIDGPFSQEETVRLLPLIEAILEFSHSKAIKTTADELDKWRLLGINLGSQHLPGEVGKCKRGFRWWDSLVN
jgi:hypothetical protein